MAKREATNIRNRSRGGTFSLLTKKEATQNAIAAPPKRKDTNDKKPMDPNIIMLFERGAISPHAIFANSMARCPFPLLLIIKKNLMHNKTPLRLSVICNKE